MSYAHLSCEERYQIYALRKAGHLRREIGAVLGRSPSTISVVLSPCLQGAEP